MNLIEGIFFTFFLMYIIYYIFVSERKGLNFALKMNFIGAFLAPIIGLSINDILVNNNWVSSINIYIVCVITMFILFIINYLSTIKAGLDKNDCDEYNLVDSLVNSNKALLIYLLTFMAVMLSPTLQYPFIELSSNFPENRPEFIMYSIVGFYLALVSLSTTVISYESNLKKSCVNSDTDIVLKYEKSNTTSNVKKGCIP